MSVASQVQASVEFNLKALLRTASWTNATIISQSPLQVYCILLGESLADAIVKLMILLSSVEGKLVRVNNVHHVDLVLVLGFAIGVVVAITGDKLAQPRQCNNPVKDVQICIGNRANLLT